MKRFLTVLAAVLLTAAPAGRASAACTYFCQGDLIRVVVDITSTLGNGAGYSFEQASDLGSAAAVIADPGLLKGSGYTIDGVSYTDKFNLFTSLTNKGGQASGTFAGNSSDLYVAYFAVDNTGGYRFWTSGTATGAETNLTAATTYVNQVGPNAMAILGTPGRLGYAGVEAYNLGQNNNGSNIWFPTVSGAQCYWRDMDGTQLTYQGSFDKYYVNGRGDGDASISIGGSAKQGLFYWYPANTLQTITASLILQTFIDSNGNIVTTASAAEAPLPLPPSVLLFGSGLLGLIGIGRRKGFKVETADIHICPDSDNFAGGV
jgi:hypothetical protein